MKRLSAILLILIFTSTGWSQTPGRISARVTDSDGGVNRATIHLLDGEQIKFSSRSNSAGNFSFINIPPAVYTLSIQKNGYLTFKKSIRVSERANVKLAIELKKEGASAKQKLVLARKPEKPVLIAEATIPKQKVATDKPEPSQSDNPGNDTVINENTSETDSAAIDIAQEIDEDPVPDFVEFPDEPAAPEGGMAAIVKNIEYPRLAQQTGIQGKVLLTVIVGKDGDPVQVDILKSATSILDEAAIETVYKSKFIPGRHGGQPVISRVTIPVQFKLK